MKSLEGKHLDRIQYFSHSSISKLLMFQHTQKYYEGKHRCQNQDLFISFIHTILLVMVSLRTFWNIEYSTVKSINLGKSSSQKEYQKSTNQF